MIMKTVVVGILAAGFALGSQAQASTVNISISGGGFSGSGVITITPNVAPSDPNSLCGTAGQNACRTDPVGAYSITSITGTFSDPTDGIFNAAITGLVPINPADERDPIFDPLVPSSLSFIDYTGGYLTYNNLFFPGGSPIDCDYPGSGTLLDVFGMAFTLANGDTVNVWGDGNFDGDSFGPLTYGLGISNPDGLIAYDFSGIDVAVPEPAAWLLMLLGVGGVGAALRLGRRRAHHAPA